MEEAKLRSCIMTVATWYYMPHQQIIISPRFNSSYLLPSIHDSTADPELGTFHIILTPSQ